MQITLYYPKIIKEIYRIKYNSCKKKITQILRLGPELDAGFKSLSSFLFYRNILLIPIPITGQDGNEMFTGAGLIDLFLLAFIDSH